MTEPQNSTTIYKKSAYGELCLGYLDSEGNIYADTYTRPEKSGPQRIGYVDDSRHIFRVMQHSDQELGSFTSNGTVRSRGLFEGGELGWVEEDGVVIRAGLIFEEEEVGRVEGQNQEAAGAALLLLFLPKDFETNKYENR